jgi:hypothetical protein
MTVDHNCSPDPLWVSAENRWREHTGTRLMGYTGHKCLYIVGPHWDAEVLAGWQPFSKAVICADQVGVDQ